MNSSLIRGYPSVRFSSAGGSVGVDLTDPGFWNAGLDLVERQLDDAEAAAREAGKAG